MNVTMNMSAPQFQNSETNFGRFNIEHASEYQNVLFDGNALLSGWYVVFISFNRSGYCSTYYYAMRVGEHRIATDIHDGFIILDKHREHAQKYNIANFCISLKSYFPNISFETEDVYLSTWYSLYASLILRTKKRDRHNVVYAHGMAYLDEDKHLIDMESYIDAVSSFKIYKSKTRPFKYDTQNCDTMYV